MTGLANSYYPNKASRQCEVVIMTQMVAIVTVNMLNQYGKYFFRLTITFLRLCLNNFTVTSP